MRQEQLGLLEALLFVAGEPVALTDMAAVLGVSAAEAAALAEELRERKEREVGGLAVRRVKDTYQLCTVPAYGQILKERYAVPLSLSNAALETLAIVAFKGPVTRAQIEELRGVGSDRSLAGLLEKDLIMEVGRADAPGRPILYQVTPFFERRAGNPLPEGAAEGAEE